MSPEQARKHPVDHRADVFSTAVVLWELIAWQLLPSGGDYVERWRRAAYPKFDRPSVFQPTVPPEIEAALMKALQVNPKDRQQTCDELRDELAACLAKVEPPVSQSSLSAFVASLFASESERERSIVAEALSGANPGDGIPEPPWAEAESFPRPAGDAPITDVVSQAGSGSADVPAGSAGKASEGESSERIRDGTDPDRTMQASRAEIEAASALAKARADTATERPAVRPTDPEATATPKVAYSPSPYLPPLASGPNASAEDAGDATRPARSSALSPSSSPGPSEPSVETHSTSSGGRTRYYPSPRNLTLLLGAAVFLAAVLLGFLIVAAAASDSDALPAQQEAPAAAGR
jgi:serine/threonine-protein kinase